MVKKIICYFKGHVKHGLSMQMDDASETKTFCGRCGKVLTHTRYYYMNDEEVNLLEDE